MNLQNIFNAIEKTDPEIYERLDSRRKIMHRFKNFGGKLALTAIPVALGSMLNKAYGQTPSNIVDILNFALNLEYLELDYYTTAFTNGIADKIDAPEIDSFTLIKEQEGQHVNFLTTTITSLGGSPIPNKEFDFTAGGAYPQIFSNKQYFYSLAQSFEDIAVRTYKGQVTGLMSDNEILTAALQIHSVEGRHASHVRYVRKLYSDQKEKPWITGKNPNGVLGMQAAYDGEENTTQLGIDLTKLSNISSSSATESFDEPLTMDQVNEILADFKF